MATPIDICFLGDSLTEYWTSDGGPVWESQFEAYHVANFGVAGDRAENILYRLQHVDIASHAPTLFVLLAGTNNLAHFPPDTPEETVSAIKSIIEHLLTSCPTSSIILLTLPPCGYDPNNPLGRRVFETNRQLKALALPDNVQLIDIYPVLTDEARNWIPGMTIDGAHFTLQAYEQIAKTIKPLIETVLSKQNRTTPET